jgi:hypothetical protein
MQVSKYCSVLASVLGTKLDTEGVEFWVPKLVAAGNSISSSKNISVN